MHGLHRFWGRLWHLEFPKSIGNLFPAYRSSLEALFAIMCYTACILDCIFLFSQCFRHHFAEKWTLLSEFTSHKYGRLTLPARYVVFTCRHDVVLLEWPALNCMLCFAALKLLYRSKIEGRRCCPPQRAFKKGSCRMGGVVPRQRGTETEFQFQA